MHKYLILVKKKNMVDTFPLMIINGFHYILTLPYGPP